MMAASYTYITFNFFNLIQHVCTHQTHLYKAGIHTIGGSQHIQVGIDMVLGWE